MKKLNTLLVLCLLFLLISCERDSEHQEDLAIENRSIVVDSVEDIEPWFNQYIVDNIGQEHANDAFELFDIRWDKPMQWNDSTFVYPMHHFVSHALYGYTRLFVQLQPSDSPLMYFYTVYPDNQDQIEFTTTDIINFNGRLVVFDIMEGYKERIQYVDGELKNYYSGGDLILSRGEIEFPNWWAPRRVAGHGWSWNPNDNGGCCCGAQCGGSNCGPCNGSGGNDTGFDINIINIPGKPGWLIHGNGSNSSGGTGGSGSSGGSSAGGGTNGNPKNPIDEAGLDEIRRQQFANLVCDYADRSTSGCSCQQLMTVIDISCLDEPDFFTCAATSDDCDPSNFTEEDECTGAIALFEATYGLTLTVKEKRAIRKAINDNDDVSCGGEGFEEEVLFTYISTKLDLDDNKECLKNNLSELKKIQSFLTKHDEDDSADDCMNSKENLSKAIGNAYADAMCNEGITQLDLGDIGNSNDPLWNIMKEQLWGMVTELVADFIPGGTLALLGPELFDNLDSGNWMDAMYNSIDIVLNEADACFPAAKITSLGLGLYTNGKHLDRFYNAFKKAKNLGDDVVAKLYMVLKSKLGDDIFKKFKWVNNSVGSEISDVIDPLDFWDEIVSNFGGTLGGGNGNELTLSDIPGFPWLTIKFYPISTTPPHCPTLSFKLNTGFEFKIRFC